VSDGRFTLLCLADAMARQAAAMRGERHESKLETWVESLGIKPRWLHPNACTPSLLPDAMCQASPSAPDASSPPEPHREEPPDDH
jgi:hypothetical protein